MRNFGGIFSNKIKIGYAMIQMAKAELRSFMKKKIKTIPISEMEKQGE
jgi:hypothetical protein